MRHRISCYVFVMAAVVAFYGTVTAQSLNYSDAVTVPQVDSKMPQTLSERQLKGEVLDGHGNQVGRNVGPNEAISVNANAKIKDTQGGDDLIRNPSGDVIGVVRPTGESHGFGDGNKEVVPQRTNQNSNEVGNNPALRQPQSSSNIEQSQNTRIVSMKELSDGTFTDGTKTYTIDDKGCLIDAESGEKTQYYIPDSKCERDRNVESQERFCKAQEPISTKEANRIAYGRSLHFTSSRKEELAMNVLRNGEIENWATGTVHSVKSESSEKTFIHIHSHPQAGIYDRYGAWPSWGDLKSYLARMESIKNILRDNDCDQSRTIYHYIVHFTVDSGFDSNGSDGPENRGRRIYLNVGRTLLRYDLNGVYEVYSEKGDERIYPTPEWAKQVVNRDNGWYSVDSNGKDIAVWEMPPYDFRDSSRERLLFESGGGDKQGRAVARPVVQNVKKALEEFHKKFLTMPNSQFKWQQIQAYLDLVVSLESWTLPPEKVLNKLVQEGSIIRTRNNTWKDLVETQLASDDSKSCWVKEKVGVCGWCRCQPPHKTPKYEHAWLGACAEARAFDGQREQNDVVVLLLFPVCKQCGKCYTYRRMGDDSDNVELHIGPYEEDIDVHISQTHKIVAARKKMEDAILSIPDGEIVVPIKKICHCKHSRDKKPNIFAFYERQESEKIPRRYICADCSGLYSPNNASNSTAK